MQASDELPKELPCDLMLLDVMGPFPNLYIHQNKYILTLHNHASTFVFCFPIKTRDQVPKILADTLHLIRSVFKDSVKFLQSNNAKEYSVQSFRIMLTNMGTQQLFTGPCTPEQNGEAEQLNRTLGDSERKILRASGLPLIFWLYAYKCAAYIHNMIPNSQSGDQGITLRGKLLVSLF
ncbi:hypothetical protein O181_075873 [Austropuccinia psidii MF-1]|uniref:Integrase catalytic domain-containing protein n=1 Tax=Austropuccinia psidii MF-1 TaxID=1389203 RepID=A0A9Q3FDV3_9BASI|nr:hypothetical protein [Austropuccinia psidii MF-1]